MNFGNLDLGSRGAIRKLVPLPQPRAAAWRITAILENLAVTAPKRVAPLSRLRPTPVKNMTEERLT